MRKRIMQYIDLKMAFAGAAFMGAIVWLVNLEHGALNALPAALKQGAYTFLFAGVAMRWCERLALAGRGRAMALAMAFLGPSAMAIGLTCLVHSLKGTPEPLLSTVPTMILAPPSFFLWGLRKRMARDRGAASERDGAP